MKINWKVRFRNPIFWVTVTPLTFAFVYTALGLFGIVPTISEQSLVNAVLMLVEVLSAWGVLVDPTTKGTSDSDLALTYEEPKGE